LKTTEGAINSGNSGIMTGEPRVAHSAIRANLFAADNADFDEEICDIVIRFA
jgi:hypothetical protein